MQSGTINASIVAFHCFSHKMYKQLIKFREAELFNNDIYIKKKLILIVQIVLLPFSTKLF